MKDHGLRIVCGGKWTADGRWVVIGPMWGRDDAIVFDPCNNDPWIDLADCQIFIRDIEDETFALSLLDK